MVRIKANRCLFCNKLLDGATIVADSNVKPKPGDVTICIYCGHIMAFASDLAFRELNGAEIVEIAGDRRILMAQRAIHDVMHKKTTG